MSDEAPAANVAPSPDVRLYVCHPEGWTAVVKQTSERMYCYQKNPGEDYFHLIVAGEIYLTFGEEKLCLNCAWRRGDVTQERLFWQHRRKSTPPK
jgi:hypothetical protein